MKAERIEHSKVIDESGNIIEIKLWKLPDVKDDRPHGYKYSLVYIIDDVRVIGYDNAEGKEITGISEAMNSITSLLL